MEIGELAAAVDAVETEVNKWEAPVWGRDDVNAAVALWDSLDRLIGNLMILRRDHAIVLARRIPDQYTAPVGNGTVTVHRNLPKTEKWNGAGVLLALSQTMIDSNGEMVAAIPYDTARKVIPACGDGQTSSKWKMGELRKAIPNATEFRDVEWGEAQIARGQMWQPNTKPVAESPASAQVEPDPSQDDNN